MGGEAVAGVVCRRFFLFWGRGGWEFGGYVITEGLI